MYSKMNTVKFKYEYMYWLDMCSNMNFNLHFLGEMLTITV